MTMSKTTVPPPSGTRCSRLVNTELIRKDVCELSSIVWQDRLCHMTCVRPVHSGSLEEYYLELTDAKTGEVLSHFAQGYGLGCAHVHNGIFYAFASRYENSTWNDVTLFKSSNLQQWETRLVLRQENEHLFNTSVCQGPDGFVMAYESNDETYPAFTIKFARSEDLQTWFKIPDAIFGTDRYTACPCIRHVNGYYYVLYLESSDHDFETYVNRSRDLKRWELSRTNPVLRPTAVDEGVNTSDPEVVEFDGKTYIYYAVGDQRTWMNVKRGVYPGDLAQFFEQWYKQPGIKDRGALH